MIVIQNTLKEEEKEEEEKEKEKKNDIIRDGTVLALSPDFRAIDF